MFVLLLLVLATLLVGVASAGGAAVVGAAPLPGRLAGITVTPTASPPQEATPTPVPPVYDGVCEPTIRKRTSRAAAQPGDEVVFAIDVVNEGQEAAIDVRVFDDVPDVLEILEVQVIPDDQGQEVLPRRGQRVLVDLGTLGQDFETTVVIRTRVREDAPPEVCIENAAEFRAPNCPDRRAAVVCWQLPEAGGAKQNWTLIAGLATSLLGLGLVLLGRRLKE
jgi:LPXTG-motif cell wall-anchored protein/uncharacterized repeat protein (TIGR01451 family)